MNSLTIQVLIVIASFLIYRILRTGFDSWKAVLIDFAIVAFLFALQYFLQTKAGANSQLKKFIPSTSLSTLLGVSFPDSLKLDQSTEEPCKTCKEKVFLSLKFPENIYFESGKRISINLKSEEESERWENSSKLKIVNPQEYYMIQFSIETDKTQLDAKISMCGDQNNIFKSVHRGENVYLVKFNGPDTISFEFENGHSDGMILETSTIHILKI